MQINKVVIPVAGWGTRSLPATKNIPKEMLPVYKKPVVQYVVEEAMYAGLTDVVFVNNQNKRVLEDHFDYNLALEGVLERAGKTDLLKEVRSVAEMVNIISVRQKQQLGLGHAVLTAREAVGDEPFAVMVGDDLMFGMEPGIQQLLEVYHSEKLPVIGVVQVPADKVDQYGIIQADEFAPGLYRVRDLVEKPAVGQAPSRLAIVGRYVLLPEMFDHLAAVEPGHGGEIQLTDALRVLARNNRLLAVRLRGQRFDTGDWAEYLTANIYFALQDEELRADLVERLEELLPPRK
jgi:UTP--glucose-1-phosphate uridylyltransferase